MRALVLSGSGSKGQYHVGVCRHLLDDLHINFGIYAGSGIGSLITAVLAQHSVGREDAAYRELESLFNELSTHDIWQHWAVIHEAAGAFLRSSFYNSEPLERLVHSRLRASSIRTSGKLLRIGATSLTTGTHSTFTEKQVPLIDAVLASISFPGFFKSIRSKGQVWTGGIVHSKTPIMAAIEAGATEVVVVTTIPDNTTASFDYEPTAFDIAFRNAELKDDEIIVKDIKLAMLYTALADSGGRTDKISVKIVHIRPSSELNADSLKFDSVESYQVQLRGYRDAIALDLQLS